ncbi:MAG: response regulator [Verrucomicrobiota bacterium]|nr:response regulator [Verrucomicrobiota bacterium]
MTFLKKILLVDHEPKVTALLRRALESTGQYLVKVEQDSRLALHAAPWFRPDLVLLDAEEAEAESQDVNRQLKCEPALKDTPFLFLSGNAAPEKKVVTGGFISGYSFLATAVTLNDLIRCVDEMLRPAPAVRTRVKNTR